MRLCCGRGHGGAQRDPRQQINVFRPRRDDVPSLRVILSAPVSERGTLSDRPWVHRKQKQFSSCLISPTRFFSLLEVRLLLVFFGGRSPAHGPLGVATRGHESTNGGGERCRWRRGRRGVKERASLMKGRANELGCLDFRHCLDRRPFRLVAPSSPFSATSSFIIGDGPQAAADNSPPSISPCISMDE